MDNTTFIFDGIRSDHMGLHNVRINDGLHSSPYFSGQDIIEDHVMNKDMPYFIKTKRKPLEFEVVFSLLNEQFTPERKYEIAKWLFHDNYKEFQTTDDLGKYYYVIATNKSDFIGKRQLGYFTVNFRCDASWAWSPLTIDYYERYDLPNITKPTIIEMENKSNIFHYYKPDIYIEFLEDTLETFTLKNLSDMQRETSFNFGTGIDNTYRKGEVIYLDNINERIKSNDDLLVGSRLSDFNKNWFRLIYGVNRIEVSNKCRIKTCMQFPIFR